MRREEVGRVADRQEGRARGGQGDRVRAVHVHDTTDIRPGRHYLGVDGVLPVPYPVALDDSAVRGDQMDALRRDLLKAPACGLEPSSAALLVAGRRVTPDEIAVTRVGQDPRSSCHQFAWIVRHTRSSPAIDTTRPCFTV